MTHSSEAVYGIVKSEVHWLEFLGITIVSGTCRKLNINKGGGVSAPLGGHGLFEMIKCEMESEKVLYMPLIYERLEDTRGSFRINFASRDDMMLPRNMTRGHLTYSQHNPLTDIMVVLSFDDYDSYSMLKYPMLAHMALIKVRIIVATHK